MKHKQIRKHLNNKMGIKWKVFCYLAVFILITLALLWMFQIAFLDDFYRAIKTNTIKSTAQTVEKQLQNEHSTDQLENIATKKDIFIRVINADGTDRYIIADGPGKALKKLSKEDLSGLKQQVDQNGGPILQISGQKKWTNDKHKIDTDKMPLTSLLFIQTM